jgi:hypothetical protein
MLNFGPATPLTSLVFSQRRTPGGNRTVGDFEKKYCLIVQQNFETSQAKLSRKSLFRMSIKTLLKDFQLDIRLEIIWMLLDFKENSMYYTYLSWQYFLRTDVRLKSSRLRSSF